MEQSQPLNGAAPRPGVNRQVEGVSEERYVPASLPQAANDRTAVAREITEAELQAADTQYEQRKSEGRFSASDVDAYQALERRELAARGQLYPSGAA